MGILYESPPEELFAEFSEQFPNMAKRVVDWYKSDDYEIRINLEDHKYVYYDEIHHSVRFPFKLNCDGRSYEDIWRKMFAFKLERRMFSMGYTQYDLAEKSGISYVTISKYLNGHASPSGHTLAKLAKILDCNLDAFNEPLLEF